MKKIKFFEPYITGNEIVYMKQLLSSHADLSGDGKFTKKVQNWFESNYGVKKAFLTTSATTALEFAVRLLHLKPGDEVIAPSFTFSSTINAILLQHGVKVVFAEVDLETLNIDPADIQRKITRKTKAIMVMHYAGVSCDMDKIMKIAKKHNLKVIEDAAQGIQAKYRRKYLGTIGDFGVLSFHDTKNITCGEGGVLFINNGSKELIEEAEIIREKGTNRTKFFRGQIDKYTWVDVGSSILPSDILAAFLYAQLEKVKEITRKRLRVYNFYWKSLFLFVRKHNISLPVLPTYATHNGHIFYVVFPTSKARDFVMGYVRERGIGVTFHYIPLHSSPQGKKLGYREGDFPITEHVSSRMLRLPLYANMDIKDAQFVIETFKEAVVSFAKLNTPKEPEIIRKPKLGWFHAHMRLRSLIFSIGYSIILVQSLNDIL